MPKVTLPSSIHPVKRARRYQYFFSFVFFEEVNDGLEYVANIGVVRSDQLVEQQGESDGYAKNDAGCYKCDSSENGSEFWILLLISRY